MVSPGLAGPEVSGERFATPPPVYPSLLTQQHLPFLFCPGRALGDQVGHILSLTESDPVKNQENLSD